MRTLTVMVVLGAMLALAGPTTADAPDVVPALREWQDGWGTLELTDRSRIVVESRALAGEAELLRDDIDAITGHDLRVRRDARARDGDLVLERDGGLGPEGYELVIGDRVTIAGEDAGVFYGTQTVLQMLRAHGGLPRGEARDRPRFRERGYLLDVGRKYWSPDYIVQTIREMAYLRLNTLHFHFTDNNAFRLVSDRFPYLAAPQAYTKADIRRFEAVARRHHVNLIPEIEMPAHAEAILQNHPELRFDCPALSGANVAMDVTKPATRRFTKQLIDEFAPLFDGPEFHIATDEYPTQEAQEQCPDLVEYAREHGFGSTADVFVDYINEMNRAVRAHGKKMVIWNWWDVEQKPTIHPDRSIKVEAWTTAAETGEDHSPQKYLDMGYEVVVSPSDTLYVTPGFPLLPDPRFLYEEWEPFFHPRLSGYQISVWSDNAIARPVSYFDGYLRRPREALADRTWGGPRRGTAADFRARANAIGSPPGVPEFALPGTLAGTPYGTSPAWDNSASTFEKAFDGDPITDFLYAEPNGGYTGIALDQPSAVALIRYFPEAHEHNLGRMVGGRFEGCTAGPASGCRTLAAIDERPDFGWNEIEVGDGDRYRWLRYVSPDGGHSTVAEIEFVAPSSEVTVDAPSELRQLAGNDVVTSYRNTTGSTVRDLRLDLTAAATDDRTVRDVRPAGRTRFGAVRPGERVSARWEVDVPLSATPGDYHVVGRAAHRDGDAGGFARSSLRTAIESVLDPEFATLDRGETKQTRLRITNRAARAVTIDWRYNRPPTANPGFALTPSSGSVRVPAGGTAATTLTASASADASGTTPPARIDLAAGDVRVGSATWHILWHPGAPPPPAGDRDLVIYDGAAVPPYRILLGSPENWGDEIEDRPVVEHATVKVENDGDGKKVTWNGTGAGQYYAQDEGDGTYLRPYLTGGGALQFDTVVSRAPENPTVLRVDCVYPCFGTVQATGLFRDLPLNTRTTVKIPLECFAETGADFARVNTPFLVFTDGAFTATFANIRWVPGGADDPDARSCESLR